MLWGSCISALALLPRLLRLMLQSLQVSRICREELPVVAQLLRLLMQHGQLRSHMITNEFLVQQIIKDIMVWTFLLSPMDYKGLQGLKIPNTADVKWNASYGCLWSVLVVQALWKAATSPCCCGHCTEETVLKLSLHPGQGPGQHVAAYTMLWKGITHIAPLREHCPQTRNESILFTGAGAYGCRKTWLSQANSLKCAAHNIFSFKYSCVHVPTVMRALQLLLPSEKMFKTAFTQSSH